MSGRTALNGRSGHFECVGALACWRDVTAVSLRRYSIWEISERLGRVGSRERNRQIRCARYAGGFNRLPPPAKRARLPGLPLRFAVRHTRSLRHKVSRRSIALSLRMQKPPAPDFKNSGKEPRCCLSFDCGAPSSRYCGRHALRGDTSCTKAVAEPRKRPHFLVGSWRTRGSLNTQNHETRALSRVAGHEAASQLAGRTSGAAPMAKRNFIFDEGTVEAVERLRKQDEEFCRRLRIAVEMGDEFCPTTVITAPCTSRPVLNYMRTD